MMDPPYTHSDELKPLTFFIEDSSNQKKSVKIDLALLSTVYPSADAGREYETLANQLLPANLRDLRQRYRVSASGVRWCGLTSCKYIGLLT